MLLGLSASVTAKVVDQRFKKRYLKAIYLMSLEPNLVVDTLVDENDGSCGDGDCSLGELVVDKSLRIDGPGAGVLAVSGNTQVRVFNIDDGDRNLKQTVTINGLTITGGLGGSFNDGGGISNRESLNINNATISGNTGSGIDSDEGELTIVDSLISENSRTGMASLTFRRWRN